MKRLAALLVLGLIGYTIYYDLTIGTLPVIKEQTIAAKSTAVAITPYFEKKVSPGDTVLSVVEGKLNGPLPVTITQVIADFNELNNGLQPENLKAGQTYRFPAYD
ncbi:hypothetical protein KDN24_09550 [Bacillus sp. Bva_UNVM-123]|uniref:hypothetical protein n=1 Tax=Bacillus sp. Bva_UNVM-123 TaxID=2829798 RepID=UPI00391F883A